VLDLSELRRTDLMAGLEISQIQMIQPLCQSRKYPAGAMVFTEGQKAVNLCVLLEGAVVIKFPIEQYRDMALSSVPIGGSFGWSALVAPNRYTTNAECATVSRVLLIDADGLHDLMTQDAGIIANVMQNLISVLSSRLKDARIQQIEMLEVIDRLRQGAKQ
jgi:CRP-like cAMP-binding protein